jgi:hypothetical protein
MFGYGTPIHRAELSSPNTSLTISNISQNYTDLFFIASLKSSFTTTDWNNMWFNGDKGTSSGNYYRNGVYTNTSNLSGARNASAPYHYGEQMVYTNGSDFNANEFGLVMGYIPNYSASSYFKNFYWGGGRLGIATSNSFSWNMSAVWLNTSPITSISMGTDQGANLVAGSILEIYGIKKVGQ